MISIDYLLRNLLTGNDPVPSLFTEHKLKFSTKLAKQFQAHVDSGAWSNLLETAASDLAAWERSSGKQQAYTSETLAQARLTREVANQYQIEQGLGLAISNATHDALIRRAVIESGLAGRMIDVGKEGKKLGLLELSSRLAPALTFPGASNYFEMGIVPYGRNARKVLGEEVDGSFISAAVAKASAMNLRQRFGTYYALAETSAAPAEKVPKSGKKPEVYICGLAGDKIVAKHEIIDTPFREEFDAMIRGLMYKALLEMYGVVE